MKTFLVWVVGGAACLAQLPPKMPDKVPGAVTLYRLPQPPATTVKPVYPQSALEHWASGTITLDVIIGADGAVEQIGCDDNCSDSRHDLVEAAAAAVKQWKWNPILVKGKPARVRTHVPVIFLLDEETPPVSVCALLKDPTAFVNKVVNISGSVHVLDRTKTMHGDCDGEVGVLDNSEITPPINDTKFLNFQQAMAMGPAPVSIRGLVRVDKSPGYHPELQIVLMRVLKNGK
ncbi:MAG TPA: energy transducer TonB [Candidatus Koribacter sp.]